ncbi:MAG: hypothetical protein ACRDS9_08355 [Pseudonocardiaceae bacterium]
MIDKDGYGRPGAGAAVAAVQPVMLLCSQPGVISKITRTVHLIPMPEEHEAHETSTLCGTRLSREEFETVTTDQGAPCTACVINQLTATTPAVELPVSGSEDDVAYRAWDWPVIHQRDQIWLNMHGDVSAIAIPIPLSTDVIRILTARHCAPAVLAHPYAPEHHIVLTGERYGITLPWPPEVQQIDGALMLPPTVTPRGEITWVQPPCKNSLRLSREIDVFGALRAVLYEFQN